MMKIKVNDKEYTTQEPNLGLFLKEIGFTEIAEMAVAVNEMIVSKKNVEKYELKDNDEVTLISITCGG